MPPPPVIFHDEGATRETVDVTDAVPPLVTSAQALAASSGFEFSCEPDVGALLAVLAATVPADGRILELGTGAGVGLAWLVHGLGQRRDVEVVSVDIDPTIQHAARQLGWPLPVRFELGDGAELVGALGSFHLIFADAPGGKLVALGRTVAALAPGGTLVVDDMDLARHLDPGLRRSLGEVRHRLLSDTELVCAELAFSSGVILAAKRR
jgi:predicted O-methyltransferase YrrM